MNRRDKVLKYIVEYFIRHAEPVGSKTLIEEYGLDYSSATIRAEMNALEQDGYLEKQHTSSGRVPSSKGYKYYIENLREKSVDEEFRYKVQEILTEKKKSIDEVISQSLEILSKMTSLASVVLGPKASEEELISVQLVPLSSTSVTCVFITNHGYVENKTFVLDEDVKLEEVKKCIELLNDRLKGTTIENLVPKMEAIKPLLSDFVLDQDILYQAIMEAFISFAKDRLETYGEQELLSQPEFQSDASKIKELLALLTSPEKFNELTPNEDEEIGVHIGTEETDDDGVSIISAKISVPGVKNGAVAIVGPTRMDYDKVVSNLEYLLKEIEKVFNKTGKDKDEEE